MKRTVNVSAALIVNNKSILAACRPLNKKLGGFWELPGGKVEEKEESEDTCIREIREELNCDIKVISLFTTCTYEYDDFILKMDIFECELKERSFPQLIEHQALMWVDKDNLFKLKWAPADEEFLPLILQKYLM